MNRIFLVVLVAVDALCNSGCSYLTARGRREAAYARYVRHSSSGRVKMQRQFTGFPKIPTAQPANQSPQITAGPESVTASNDSQ
jgi:hypothetical protein